MPITPSPSGETGPSHWADQCGVDASALVERFGIEGIAWLDNFLADYLFIGEPLDRVLVKARELSRLGPRPHSALDADD